MLTMIKNFILTKKLKRTSKEYKLQSFRKAEQVFMMIWKSNSTKTLPKNASFAIKKLPIVKTKSKFEPLMNLWPDSWGATLVKKRGRIDWLNLYGKLKPHIYRTSTKLFKAFNRSKWEIFFILLAIKTSIYKYIKYRII